MAVRRFWFEEWFAANFTSVGDEPRFLTDGAQPNPRMFFGPAPRSATAIAEAGAGLAPFAAPLAQGLMAGAGTRTLFQPLLAAQASAPSLGEDSAFVVSLLAPGGGQSFAVLHPGSLVIDAGTRTLLPGSPVNGPDLLSGDHDQLIFGGGRSGQTDISAAGHEEMIFLAGFDYALSAADGDVGRGESLTINAMQLGKEHGLAFDGSAETDGRFLFQGGAGADSFTGGSGADRFLYFAAGDSTGASYDTLVDFDFSADTIDLPVSVAGFSAPVAKGSLSQASFDTDLAAVLGAGKLAAGLAAWFTPDAGDLAGKTFLVVDANGKAGYQAGEDYVFLMSEPPPADLTGAGFFV